MSVTVNFTGICTHTRPPIVKPHRVVLVRADHGAWINGQSLPPHYPFLQIKPEYIAGIRGDLEGLEQVTPDTWRLCGVALSFDDAIGPLTYDASFADVPHLKMPKAGDPRVAMQVVRDTQAACYFDFTAGTISATTNRFGAYSAHVQVETNEAPELQVHCFWKGSPSTIELVDGAEIDVMHMGLQQRGETDKDFLLHYRLFETIDPSAEVPPPPKQRIKLPPNNISIGCSNSQYP